LQVWRGLDSVGEVGPCVVTVGVFDGVHRGHAMLLRRTVEHATARGHMPVALTFDPHPMSVVRPERAPLLLTTIAERVHLLGAAGAEGVLVVPFTPAVAAVPAREFAHSVLVDTLHASMVVVGADFHFGARAYGDVPMLRSVGAEFGFEVDAIEVQSDGTERLSSTRVRELLVAGNVEEAAGILGRPHSVTGPVITGHQRGRDLGFPTANIASPKGIALPADGVYACWFSDARTEDGKPMPAAVSIGTNPTFGVWERSIEAYVLDRDDLDLYGHDATVSFVTRLRGMEKFDSVPALVEQMHLDVEETRRVLAG
jgi:riboflavin kinase/FMN adenylyltransferase